MPGLWDNEQVHSWMLGIFYLCICGRKLQTWLSLRCHINYKSFKGKKNPEENKDVLQSILVRRKLHANGKTLTCN